MQSKWFLSVTLLLTLLITVAACQGTSEVVADAGLDFDVQSGEAPTFDGCSSTGDITTYQWKISEAPGDMEESVGNIIHSDSSCSFTLGAEMGVDDMGRWAIELTVIDGEGNQATDTVVVEVLE